MPAIELRLARQVDPILPQAGAQPERDYNGYRGQCPVRAPLQVGGARLRCSDFGKPCLLARESRLLLLALGRFTCLARGQIGSRRRDLALPVASARGQRLRLGEPRSAMSEKVQLVLSLGLLPVGGREQHAVKEE